MKHFGDILFQGAVKDEQTRHGSRAAYAAMTAKPPPDALSDREIEFIAARDSFYMASVSEDGWPYIQHRGGQRGFLKAIDRRTLAFADYRGNKQYISTGHFKRNNRAALFLMDYPNRRRLKIWRLRRLLISMLRPNLRRCLTQTRKRSGFFRLTVEAADWNCPQHITPRFTESEIRDGLAPQLAAFEQLKEENAALKARLAQFTE